MCLHRCKEHGAMGRDEEPEGMGWGSFAPNPRDPVNHFVFNGSFWPCLRPPPPALSSLPPAIHSSAGD